MQHKIKLLLPDIGSEVQSLFSAELQGSIKEPDKALQNFQLAIQKFFPQHSLVGLSSGTAALHLGLRLLGVKKRDLVLCSTFTFAARFIHFKPFCLYRRGHGIAAPFCGSK